MAIMRGLALAAAVAVSAILLGFAATATEGRELQEEQKWENSPPYPHKSPPPYNGHQWPPHYGNGHKSPPYHGGHGDHKSPHHGGHHDGHHDGHGNGHHDEHHDHKKYPPHHGEHKPPQHDGGHGKKKPCPPPHY